MITLLKSPVLTEWIDYNGHMNDAYYVVAFSKGIDEFMLHIGIDEAFRTKHRVSIYTLQSMVSYLQEVAEGEPIIIKGQVLESDQKKVRLFMTMYHEESHAALATMETLLLHVNTEEGKASPFLADTQSNIDAIQMKHNALPVPNNAGQAIQLSRKKKS